MIISNNKARSLGNVPPNINKIIIPQGECRNGLYGTF